MFESYGSACFLGLAHDQAQTFLPLRLSEYGSWACHRYERCFVSPCRLWHLDGELGSASAVDTAPSALQRAQSRLSRDGLGSHGLIPGRLLHAQGGGPQADSGKLTFLEL